ncbi:hypothetical protein INR77_09755 [Erythrobacter sp. SCSIO 43205]|uniref:hypothetical protein n=1 Tax=Erythrobacter sp. SCSIO 43205 TaxID=2779361 RepID=UPI001CA83018|nr:hypothetical protein [Erythrobacter sp. SCSIO 43205]UAB77115.1 hypothetical protein INR77_09755 [Erythrobacter sp. SCSIO 43205]
MAALTGAVCWPFVLLCFYLMPDKPDVPSWMWFLIYPAMAATIVSLILVIVYRRSDEYTLGLWHRSVSIALLVGIAIGFFGAGVEVFIDRYFYGTKSTDELEPFVSARAGEMMILILFLGITTEHSRQSWRS